MKKPAPIFLFFAIVFFAGLLHAAGDYTLIDLGTMGNDCSFALSINNNGAIAGGTGIADVDDPPPLDCANCLTTYGFKWVPRKKPLFPPDPAWPLPEGDVKIIHAELDNNLWVQSINDAQEMTGTVVTPSSMTPDAIIWDADALPVSSVPLSSAADINNFSQVVGDHWGMASWLWEDGDYDYIIPESISDCCASFPNAINDLGQVVGSAYRCSGDDGYFAFLWEHGELFDLNERIGRRATRIHLSEATDINKSGQIVGDCEVFGGVGLAHDSSFLLTGRKVTDLGFTGAKAINDKGQVVGSHFLYESQSSDESWLFPVVGKANLFDLKYLIVTKIVYTDLEVEDINNAGQIVGSATIRGAEHAVLLNPAD